MPHLPEGWEAHQSGARGLVGAFVAVRPSLLSDMPSEASSAGRAWPSPRTWDMAARLLTAAALVEAAEEVRAALVTGAVGPGAGIEFLNWISDMDLGDPEVALAILTALSCQSGATVPTLRCRRWRRP